MHKKAREVNFSGFFNLLELSTYSFMEDTIKILV